MSPRPAAPEPTKSCPSATCDGRVRAIRNAFRVLLVLWAGSLWSLAAWVAPTLFYAQSDRHLAGMLAARLFTIETYLGLGGRGPCAAAARQDAIRCGCTSPRRCSRSMSGCSNP